MMQVNARAIFPRPGILPALVVGGTFLLGACGDAEAGDPGAEEAVPTTDSVVLETATGFDAIDRNGDGEVDADELQAWADDAELTYVEWASAGDTTDAGLYETLFYRWDEDGDLVVDQVEWDANYTYFMDQGLADVALVDWDLDGDTELVMSEIVAGFEAADLYNRVDADGDGAISDEELVDWLFTLVDLDKDGVIDASEWERSRYLQPYHDPEVMREN